MFKKLTDGKAIGASIERLDGSPKIEGSEVFGADDWPEDALVVGALRSPSWHADFAFGDINAWASHNGVEVLTASDIPGRNRFGVIPHLAGQPALAEGTARFRGEAVALVAGVQEIMHVLDVESLPIVWIERDHALDVEVAKKAPLLHDNRDGNLLIAGRVIAGDDRALDSAAHKVGGSFTT